VACQSMSIAPQAPFARWPVQLFVPEVGFYWYAKPTALVCQSVIHHATIAGVDAHNDVLDRLLAARPEEIGAAGGVLIFNDWRSLRTSDRGVRHRQQERMSARARGYTRRTVVVVNPANRLLRMAIETYSLFSTVMAHRQVEIVLRPDPALGELGLEPPRAGEPFPGRAK
jgi:hypothetical protein